MIKQISSTLSTTDAEALRIIRNQIVKEGQAPSVRELAKALGYQSPRSAALILERLTAAGYIARRSDGQLQLLKSPASALDHARTVEVPLVGRAPCGAPLLATENVEATISISEQLARPPHRYFMLRAQGDSMNQAGIQDGSLVLVRQQPTAEAGQVVVALIDDEATIKEFRPNTGLIALMPRSSNPAHKPILLTQDFIIQGVVIASLPDLV